MSVQLAYAAPAAEGWRAAVRDVLPGYPAGVRLQLRWRAASLPAGWFLFCLDELPRRGTVVDLGCGHGLFTIALARQRPELDVVGVDYVPGRIALAREAARSCGAANVRFQTTDLRGPRLEGPYDGLVAHRVLHSLAPSTAESLAVAVHTACKPGAPFLLVDTDVRPFWRWALGSAPRLLLHPTRPHSYFTPEARIAQLQRAGFRDLRFLPLGAFHLPRSVAIWGRA